MQGLDGSTSYYGRSETPRFWTIPVKRSEVEGQIACHYPQLPESCDMNWITKAKVPHGKSPFLQVSLEDQLMPGNQAPQDPALYIIIIYYI